MGAELAIIAKLQDEASSGIRALRGEVEGLEPSAGIAAKGFATLQTVGAAALTALAAAAVAVGGAIVSSIGVAADFESQIAILSTAAGDAGTSLDTLRGAAMAVGADVSLVGVSASGAADAMTILYKAGLTTGEIFGDLNGYLAGNAELSGALRAAIDGAAASELDMAQAAELAATTLATFGGHLTTSAERAEFVNVALNNFVQTADASVASVADLAAAMATIGPTAAQFGFSLQDTNTALALLSTRGIAGSEAGTALKSMFTNLMRPTEDVKGALNELGVSLYNADGTMRSMPSIIGDLSQALYGMNEVTTIVGGRTAEQNHQLQLAQRSYDQATDAIYKHNAGLKVLTDSNLQKYVEQQAAANAEIQRLSAVTGTASTAVSQLTEEQRNQYIQTLAGAYGMKAMAVLLMEGTAGWEAMEKAISEAATIQEVAAARTQTFSGAMEALGGVIETIQIGIGSAFLPVLTALAKAFAQLASDNMQEIVSAFEAVGNALTTFFDAVMNGTPPIQAFADSVAGLAEALGMPAEQVERLRGFLEGLLTAVSNIVGPIVQAITSFVSWKDVLAAVGIAIASVVIPALIAIVQFLAPIIATITAVILAVAALRNAWESDFLGIRSAVEGLVEVFGRFVEAIRVLTDENARVQAMVDALAALPEPLQILAAAVANFINTLRDGGSLVDAFRAGLETLKQAIFDWAGTTNWADVGRMILDKIAEAFSNLGDRAATTAANILNWISTSVNSIDWHAVGLAIVNGIAAAIAGVVGLLVTAGTAISNFFTGFFTSDKLQAAGQNIVTALGNAISGLSSGISSGLESIRQAILNWAGVTSWSEVGGVILDRIAETFRNLGDRVADMEAGIFNWISNAVNGIEWREVGEKIIDGIVAAITAVVGLLVAAGTAIVNYFVGFFTNDELAPAAGNLITSLGNAIGELAGGIGDGLAKVRDAIFAWAGVEDWSGVAQKIIEMVGTALGTAAAAISAQLGEWQQAIFDWAGVEDWSGVAQHIADLIGEKLGEFGSAVAEKLGEWQKAIFDWAGAENWLEVAQHIADLIGEKLGEVADAIKEKLSEWQKAIFDWADAENWQEVADHIAKLIGEKLGEAKDAIKEKLADWQQAIFDWADAENWQEVAEHIAELIGVKLGEAKETLASKLSEWRQAIWDWADTEDWQGVADHIAELVADGLSQSADQVTPDAGSWSQALKDWAGTENWEEVSAKMAEMIGDGLADQVETVTEKMSGWVGEFTAWVERTDFKQVGYDITSKITDAFLDFKTTVETKIATWLTDLKTATAGYTWWEIGAYILMKIVEALTGKGGGEGGGEGANWDMVIATWIAEIGNAIIRAQASLNQLGKDIVAGIAAGITAATDFIRGAIQGVIDAARGAGEQAAGAQSPATAFMPLGNDITAGVAVGMLQATGLVVDAIQQIAGQLQTEGAKAFGEAMKALAEGLAAGMNAILDLSAFPGVGGSFLDNLRSVVEMLAQMVAEVARANVYGEEALGLLGTFVDVAGGIADLILPLIVAITEIARFQPPGVATFTAALAQLAAYLAQTVEHVAAANQYSTLVLEGMGAFLDVIEQIADTVGPFLAALVDINAFGTVDLWFFHEGIAQLWYTMLLVVQKVQELAVLGEQTLERMEGFLEVVQAMADTIGPFIEALYELNAFGTVDLNFFHEGLAQLAYVMLMVVGALNEANTFGTAALEAVRLFAETAGAIADMIGPMIEGLLQINALDGTMNEVAYHAVYFRNGVRALVDALASAAALFTTGTLQHVQQFAETAGAIAEIIVPAVEGLMIIGTLTGDLNYIGVQATYFRNALRTIVSALASAAELFTAALLHQVQLFAETAGTIMEVIAPAIEGFALISTLTGEVNYIGIQATYLRNGLRIIVTAISSAAELFTAGLLAHTQLFAETAGEIVDLIADAIEALALLANYVAAAGLEAAATAFAVDLTSVINIIVDALEEAGLLANEAIVKAGELADGLSDILGLVEDGVEALTALASYVTAAGLAATAQRFAADLAAALIAIVAGLQQAGVLTSASIAAAAELADGLADVLGMVEDGVDALTALTAYVPAANLVPLAQAFAVDLAAALIAVANGLQQAGVLASAAIIAAGEMADGLADVLGMVEDGVEALTALAAYVPAANLVPLAQQFAADLATVIIAIINGLVQAGVLANEAVARAGELAEGLSDILGVVTEGVEAIAALAAYVPATGVGTKVQQFAADLAATITAIVNGLVQAGLLANEAVVRAGELAGGLGDILGVVAEGLEAITALAAYVPAAGIQAKAQQFAVDLAAVITAIVNGLVQAGLLANEAIARAAEMASRLGDLLGLVAAGVEAIKAITEYQSVNGLAEKVAQFATDLVAVATTLTNALSAAAQALGQEAMAAATRFATDAAAVAQAVTAALQAIAALAETSLADGVATKIQNLGTFLVIVSTILSMTLAAAAQAIGATVVAAATAFATAVTALVGEVQAALAALAQLAGLAMPNIQPILAYIVASAQLIQTSFSAAGDIGAAVAYAAAFRANLQQLVTEIQAAVAALNQIAGTGTTGSIGAALAAIAASLQNTAGQFTGAGQVLANALITALAGGISAGQGQVQGAAVYMLEATRAAGENVGRNFDSVGHAIIDAIASAVLGGQGQVIAAVTQVVNAAIAAGVAAARAAASVGQQLVQAAVNEVNNGRGQLDTAGSAAGNALIDGMARAITAGRSRVVSAIISTVTAAINAAKAALGIASPSKVAIDLLSNFMNTAASTVEGLRGRLADAMATAVSGAAAAAATGMSRVQLVPQPVTMARPALGDSLAERVAAAAVGRGGASGAAVGAGGTTQVVFYGNVVLPNVTDSRSFLEELDALRGAA